MLQFKYKYLAHVFEYRFPIHQERTVPWTAAQDPIPKSLKWFQPHHPPPSSSGITILEHTQKFRPRAEEERVRREKHLSRPPRVLAQEDIIDKGSLWWRVSNIKTGRVRSCSRI